MIRVLICDDQMIVSEGLQLILETDPDIEVVGVAQDGAEAIEKIPDVKPDIVLMDLKMPGMNGIHATQVIRRDFPDIPVLVLTTFDADEWVFDAVRSGASGYLLKDSPRDRLLTAVKETVEGKTHIDPSVAGKILSEFNHGGASNVDTSIAEKLNDRELEILRLIATGLTNAEIARRLHLSEGTVRNYVSSVFTALGVSDRTQAAILALRYGIADL
ncbi:MAG: response regulator transcription factor [Chloroflexota bacterium]